MGCMEQLYLLRFCFVLVLIAYVVVVGWWSCKMRWGYWWRSVSGIERGTEAYYLRGLLSEEAKGGWGGV